MADSISCPDSYLIDLQTWGIANDLTNPLATSNGINNALQWAKNNGYTKVSLPKGNYLIEKNTPIALPSNIVFDLNESTIKIETNKLQKYSILTVKDKSNVAICNGVIEGDKLSHDYVGAGGTSEWGIGILVTGSCRNVKIEGMKIMDVTGYGICGGSDYNQIAVIYLTDLESGTFDSNGIVTMNTSFTRTNKYLSLSNSIINKLGFFSLYGNGYGSYGTDVEDKEIDMDLTIFTVYFYDDTDKYLGSVTRRTFDSVYKKYFPSGATKYKIAFRYDYSRIKTCSMSIRAHTYTNGLTIANCELVGCRTLGIALTGVQNVIVENCEIHGVGGAAPGFGIDIEDGYNVNQNIIIRNNHFHDNKNGSIIVVSARNVLLEHNKFYGPVSMAGGKGQSYISQYNLYNGCSGTGFSNAGKYGSNMIFNGDAFLETQIFIDGEAVYKNTTFDNVNFITSCNNYETIKFIDCRFNFEKKDFGWSWILRKGSLVFDGCTFNIAAVQYYYFRDESHLGDPNKTNFTMNNCDINTGVFLSSNTIQCNKLVLTNNRFVGTHDNIYQPFNFTANQVALENNDIDGIPFTIDGRGSDTRFVIKNNKLSYSKTNIFFGPNICEGFYVRKFDYIECTGNSIFLPLPNTVNLRVFSFFCEKFLRMNDNTIISPNSTSKVQLFGAYRPAGDTTTVPPLVAALENNYVKNITVEKNYTSQLSKPEIGNGFIKLD